MANGKDLLRIAAKHIGERYIFGTMAPKDNANWKGPWDCAEFASWVVYQAGGILYGCDNDHGDPDSADAYTGYWARDAESLGNQVSVDDAIRTPGAALLRIPAPGLIGHIVFSDGLGGTIEAHSTKRGVIAGTVSGRRWDTGILIPDISYSFNADTVPPQAPVGILRLKTPRMTGASVKRLQQALKALGYNPGPIDGEFGPKTAAAVAAFQLAKGLVPDGEAGPKTMKALGL